jgi:two-component system, OmpR family, response regulator MprA
VKNDQCAASGPTEAAARVLVADDHTALRESLMAALGSQGFAVSPASDGAEALAALRAGSFDVAVVDVRMPEMDGSSCYGM